MAFTPTARVLSADQSDAKWEQRLAESERQNEFLTQGEGFSEEFTFSAVFLADEFFDDRAECVEGRNW